MAVILDRQRRTVEVGIIRIGEKAKNGAPRSRETFRFTTAYPELAEAIAEAFGGEVRPWSASETKRPGWEVCTDASQIKALLSTRPVGDGDTESLSQHFEQWKGNTCIRRCNGQTCDHWENGALVASPCLCDCSAPDFKQRQKTGAACKLISRLRVILTEVPALGLWRLNTGSDVFADEIQGLMDQIRVLGLDGQPVPVLLGITFREKRTGPNQPTSKFPVVSVTLDTSPVSLPDLISSIRGRALGMSNPSSLGALPISEQPALTAPSTAVEETDEAYVARILGDTASEFFSWCEGEGVEARMIISAARKRGISDSVTFWEGAERCRERAQGGS